MWIRIHLQSTTNEIEPGRVSPAPVFATDGKTQAHETFRWAFAVNE